MVPLIFHSEVSDFFGIFVSAPGFLVFWFNLIPSTKRESATLSVSTRDNALVGSGPESIDFRTSGSSAKPWILIKTALHRLDSGR